MRREREILVRPGPKGFAPSDFELRTCEVPSCGENQAPFQLGPWEAGEKMCFRWKNSVSMWKKHGILDDFG